MAGNGGKSFDLDLSSSQAEDNLVAAITLRILAIALILFPLQHRQRKKKHGQLRSTNVRIIFRVNG